MYGIVNKAIQDLVTDAFGAAKWVEVKEKSGIDVDFFLSNEPYDDDITYKLAQAASDVLGISVGKVLNTFGEYWIIKTGKEKYGDLMNSGGENLKEFLINLPNFHNRIMLMFPKLTPPEFKVSNIENNSICIHYFSQRIGLQDFVHGLLNGLGIMYKTNVIIELLQSRDNGSSHEIFKVSW